MAWSSFLIILCIFAFAAQCESNRLPTNVVPEAYDLWIKADLVTYAVVGQVIIKVNVVDVTNTVVINYKDINIDESETTLRILTTGLDVEPISSVLNPAEEILTLTFAQDIAVGSYELFFVFTSNIRTDLKGLHRSSYGTGANLRNFAVTIFEPTYARTLFPCFDEPQMKAKFTVQIYHQPAYTVISNMPLVSTMGPIPEVDGFMLTTFEVSPEMSTYSVAFVISDFQLTATSDNLYRISHIQSEAAGSDTVFALDMIRKAQDSILQFISQPPQLSQFDLVAVPNFGKLTSSNWGLTAVNSDYLLYENDKVPAKIHQEGLRLISRAMALNWFGHAVTPAWWDSLWLSEGFARFFEYYTTQQIEPAWVTWDLFQVENVHAAFQQDVSSTSRSVSTAILTPDEIKYDFDVSVKAACLIRMFYEHLGTEVFQAAVKNYFVTNKLGSVTPSSLYEELQSSADASNVDLPYSIEELFESWVTEPGYPIVTANVDYLKKTIVITQKRFYADPTEMATSLPGNYIIPLSIDTESETQLHTTTWLKGAEMELPFTPDMVNEFLVQVNQHQHGYYRVNYNKEHWLSLIEYLNRNHTVFNVHNRAQLIDNAVNLAKIGLIDYDVVFSLLDYLKKEEAMPAWATANNALTFLTRIMRGSAMYDRYENFLLRISKMNYLSYNLTITDYTANSDRIHRLNTVHWACYSGLPECVAEARALILSTVNFEDLQAPDIDAEIKPIVYCTAAKYLYDDVALEGIQFSLPVLADLYAKRSENLDELNYLITGAGCSRNADNIAQLLDVAILTVPFLPLVQIYAVDRQAVLVSLINGSYEGSLAVLNFLVASYTQINRLFGNDNLWTDVFVALGQKTVTEELLNIWTAFNEKFDTQMSAQVKLLSTENFKIATANVEWGKLYVPTIENWLEAYVEETEKEDDDGAAVIVLNSSIFFVTIAMVLYNIKF